MKDKPIKIILNLSEIMFVSEILKVFSTTDELTNKEQFFMRYLYEKILTQLPKDEQNESK